jgi:glycosyltransferase involved in cell wall biosynthesis
VKIVLATHHYPPTYVAGVELVAERLARWLVKRGHVVHVVCIEDIDAAGSMKIDTQLQDGVTVHRLYLKLTGDPLPLGIRHRDASLERWFGTFLARVQPDIFHSLSSYLVTASLLDAARSAGIPTIASLHDYWYVCPRTILQRSNGERCNAQVTATDCARCVMGERRRYRFMQRVEDAIVKWTRPHSTSKQRLVDPKLTAIIRDRQTHLDATLRSVDRIITPALLSRELLLARGFSPEHVQHVRHGIHQPSSDVERGAPPDGRLRLIYLGQLAPHKGVHILIDAFKRVARGPRGPVLTIYGDGSKAPAYVRGLERLATGEADIHFGGMYRNTQVWDVLREADVLVVPSLWFEISPLVILEAFAARVPVIASDLRNMNTQITSGVDGLLFTAGDSAALATHVQRLVDDPQLVTLLKHGISKVRDLDTELAEIEAIYGQAISDRNELARASAGVVLNEIS